MPPSLDQLYHLPPAPCQGGSLLDPFDIRCAISKGIGLSEGVRTGFLLPARRGCCPWRCDAYPASSREGCTLPADGRPTCSWRAARRCSLQATIGCVSGHPMARSCSMRFMCPTLWIWICLCVILVFTSRHIIHSRACRKRLKKAWKSKKDSRINQKS